MQPCSSLCPNVSFIPRTGQNVLFLGPLVLASGELILARVPSYLLPLNLQRMQLAPKCFRLVKWEG